MSRADDLTAALDEQRKGYLKTILRLQTALVECHRATRKLSVMQITRLQRVRRIVRKALDATDDQTIDDLATIRYLNTTIDKPRRARRTR